jgi:hypothetical protein
VLLITEDPLHPEPDALIEEARRRQRQRVRRRRIVLGSALSLAVIVFGVGQLARGGGGVSATPSTAPAAHTPTVVYVKQLVLKVVPGLPVERTTVERWSSSSAPGVFREIVTLPEGNRVEIGAAPERDKVLGLEQVSYLYDAKADTIYRTGADFSPTPSPPTPRGLFEAVLAQPGTDVAGTRTYRGRRVYIVRQRTGETDGTAYVDTKTFTLMMNDVRRTDLHTNVRTLVFKTLAPTTANTGLASLSAVHPRARISQHAPPRLRGLFAKAAFPLAS